MKENTALIITILLGIVLCGLLWWGVFSLISSSEPEFSITKHECWNTSPYCVSYSDIETPCYDSKGNIFKNITCISNVMKIDIYTVQYFSEDIKFPSINIPVGSLVSLNTSSNLSNISNNYCISNLSGSFFPSEEKCEDVEVNSIEINNIEYGIKELSKEICLNESVCFTSIINATQSMQYIDVVDFNDYYEYGYCLSVDGESLEISIPSGFGDDCRIEKFNISDYDEIIDTIIIMKDELSIEWLDYNCEPNFNSAVKKCEEYNDRMDVCTIQYFQYYQCGDYRVEVIR